jgi:putative oxidoreductase
VAAFEAPVRLEHDRGLTSDPGRGAREEPLLAGLSQAFPPTTKGDDTMRSRLVEPTYSLLRFFAGALFACHGAQKLFGALGGQVADSALMKFGGVIEFVGGLLIAFGLLTPWAAFLASGMMAVAYFKAHAPGHFFPIINKGELAVVYAFLFLFIFAYGGGRYSLDAAIRRPRVAVAAA